MRFFVGIDDTDVLGRRPGTGRLARELSVHLEATLPLRAVGVVRQQLLVDPRIPYTSHNSPACLILDAREDGAAMAGRIFAAAAPWLVGRSAPGSDPGLCVAGETQLGERILAFGWRAAEEVLSKDEAHVLARAGNLRLAELGGTGDGVIGALAAVGLTAGGNSGRFLEFAGRLRQLGERVSAGTLRALGIAVVSIARNAEPISDAQPIDTGDRARPRLVHGRPVLLVEPHDGGWRCFDRKDPKSDGHGGEGKC
jgi:hypothetical protein